MPSSIPNALDPGSPLSSLNFSLNTFQMTTSRDACDDTTLDTESDGSESDDDKFEDAESDGSESDNDKFEDAQEFISSDPPELITQSAPTSKPAVLVGISWFRRALNAGDAAARGAVGAVASGAEYVVHGAGYAAGAVALGTGVAIVGAGAATVGAIQKTDGAWKRTGQVLDTRKAHINVIPPMDDDEVKEEFVVGVEVAPSPSFTECKISGIPASLGDFTPESLVSEMSGSPVYDDQSLGAMDLEEEPDILQFLVERVHEDPDYTKLLLWTVYKLGAEGIVNQSTKNAMCILEMAGIHFQLQV
ncbi:hypothetical protein BGZ58_002111 [Dissophora ornata]|nr:hypothetical protein BGZ58_002111 [Dissophora ornata]